MVELWNFLLLFCECTTRKTLYTVCKAWCLTCCFIAIYWNESMRNSVSLFWFTKNSITYGALYACSRTFFGTGRWNCRYKFFFVTQSLNSFCLSADLITASCTVNYGIVLSVFCTGGVSLFFNDRFTLCMSCLWDRFSCAGNYVFTLSNGAVNYFVIAAVDCTLSFDSVLNSSLCRCMSCLCDSNSISGELISTFSTVNYVVVMTLRIAGWVDIILFNWAAGIMITRSFKNLLRHGECTANLTLLTGRFTVFSTCWVYCLEDFLSMAEGLF